MDELRKEILRNLETNSRINIAELAVLLDVEKAAVANEVARMEREKIICGYHTLIDWEKAGEELVNALIEVRVTPQRERGFDKTAERICNYPEVSAVYLISGHYDLLVTIEGKTLGSISKFVSEKLASIDEVVNTETYFILKKYKDHGSIMFQKERSERIPVMP